MEIKTNSKYLHISPFPTPRGYSKLNVNDNIKNLTKIENLKFFNNTSSKFDFIKASALTERKNIAVRLNYADFKQLDSGTTASKSNISTYYNTSSNINTTKILANTKSYSLNKKTFDSENFHTTLSSIRTVRSNNNFHVNKKNDILSSYEVILNQKNSNSELYNNLFVTKTNTFKAINNNEPRNSLENPKSLKAIKIIDSYQSKEQSFKKVIKSKERIEINDLNNYKIKDEDQMSEIDINMIKKVDAHDKKLFFSESKKTIKTSIFTESIENNSSNKFLRNEGKLKGNLKNTFSSETSTFIKPSVMFNSNVVIINTNELNKEIETDIESGQTFSEIKSPKKKVKFIVPTENESDESKESKENLNNSGTENVEAKPKKQFKKMQTMINTPEMKEEEKAKLKRKIARTLTFQNLNRKFLKLNKEDDEKQEKFDPESVKVVIRDNFNDKEYSSAEEKDIIITDDLKTYKLKQAIKKFLSGKDNKLNYENNKDGFFLKAENRINFREDVLLVPSIKNNLFSKAENDYKSGSKRRYTKGYMKEMKEYLNNINSIDRGLNMNISDLKRKYQTEKDYLTYEYMTIFKNQSIIDKIKLKHQEFCEDVNSKFGNINNDTEMHDFFRLKYKKYEKTSFATERVKAKILKIDPLEKVKRLTLRLFGFLLKDKCDEVNPQSLEFVIEQHLKADKNYQNERFHPEGSKGNMELKNILKMIHKDNKLYS